MVQIAGVLDDREAELLQQADVDFLGFPLRLAKHPEDLSEENVARIIRKQQLSSRAILITYLSTAEKICALAHHLNVVQVQLHGEIDLGELRRLKELAPGLRAVKSLIVRGDDAEELLAIMSRLTPWVDGFLTDTYDPATGATGATGKTHNWSVSRKLVERSTLPVILAGGLHPGNVSEAIRQVRPAGVDSHTGVEDRRGRRDPELVRRFVRNAKEAFRRVRTYR